MDGQYKYTKYYYDNYIQINRRFETKYQEFQYNNFTIGGIELEICTNGLSQTVWVHLRSTVYQVLILLKSDVTTRDSSLSLCVRYLCFVLFCSFGYLKTLFLRLWFFFFKFWFRTLITSNLKFTFALTYTRNKGNIKITELRTIFQRESQNS